MSYINTTLIESNYLVTDEDYYIGVDSKKATSIILPPNPADGRTVVIKAEMKPPLGNRRITIVAKDGATIDGYGSYVIQVSHDFVRLVYRGNSWHVI